MRNNGYKYVIDTCSLIQLRRAYDYDVFPAVWETVGNMSDEGVLVSIEDVYEELKNQAEDTVFAWAKDHSEMFLPLDEIIQIKATQILGTHPNLIDLKKRKSGADPFVIATGLVYLCKVVTEEEPSNSPSKVKIPDVCKFYGIECIQLLDMLRLENFKITQV